jgi:predicted metal-binding membrane protein
MASTSPERVAAGGRASRERRDPPKKATSSDFKTAAPQPSQGTRATTGGTRLRAGKWIRPNPIRVTADTLDAIVTLRRSLLVAPGLLGLTLAAWIVTVQRMRGMDAGPGTDLGTLGWFLGIWVTMTAAMMLPSAAPTVILVASLRRAADSWTFVAGYLLTWTAYGLAAYAIYRVFTAWEPSFLAWDERGPWVAGGALIAVGLYQLTPLKSTCLRHCRTPFHFLMHTREGSIGALRGGVVHGAYCIGCCIGLMLALFALGVMSLFWMAVIAAVILVEKLLPRGEAFARVFATTAIALGVWVAVSPGSVPWLTEPTHMEMEMHP